MSFFSNVKPQSSKSLTELLKDVLLPIVVLFLSSILLVSCAQPHMIADKSAPSVPAYVEVPSHTECRAQIGFINICQ